MKNEIDKSFRFDSVNQSLVDILVTIMLINDIFKNNHND